MALIFLNGGGMRGGPLHEQLRGTPLVAVVRTAPKYRFHAVGGKYPALERVETGGRSAVGELYDIGLDTLGAHLLPSEPPELELGAIELEDGGWALATVLRREHTRVEELTDISEIGDWRRYQEEVGRQ